MPAGSVSVADLAELAGDGSESVVAAMQREARRNLGRPLLLAGVILSTVALEPPLAIAATIIDLGYDSVMDMVRPERYRGIVVHHDLQIVFSGQDVTENRDRSTRNMSDRNAMNQDLSGVQQPGTYASWRIESSTRLVRTQHDPQSTRIMTVTLTPGNTCRLDVVDTLNPGFSEYAFLRISTHTLGYFSSYRVIGTSCSIR
jgi:hypothetical protein